MLVELLILVLCHANKNLNPDRVPIQRTLWDVYASSAFNYGIYGILTFWLCL